MCTLTSKTFDPGCYPSLRTPSITIKLTNTPSDTYRGSQILSVHHTITQEIGIEPSVRPDPNEDYAAVEMLKFVTTWLSAITRSLRLPLPHRYNIKSYSDSDIIIFNFPTIKFLINAHVLVVEQLIEAATRSAGVSMKFSIEFASSLKRLSSAIPGANTRFILHAARNHGVPVLNLAGSAIQLGQGKRARLLDSTFTDRTPALAAKLVRNKNWASTVLQDAGLPALTGTLVRNDEQALNAAKSIGFPLVIKPNDCDGGVAVHCNVNSSEALLEKLSDVLKHTDAALIQPYIAARDYRIIIINNRAVAVIERIPGQVIGDGQSSVQELIDKYNAQPFRGSQPHMPLKPLTVDDQAIEKMIAEGLSLQSILPNNKILRLRDAGNIAQGGLPVDVTASCHPDNLWLAERAAQAFRLDVAGIDLLIPNISDSWQTGGAAICEVNSAPVIGYSVTRHIYPLMIEGLLQGNGKIPIIFVVADKFGSAAAHRLLVRLASDFTCVGYVGADIRIGSRVACSGTGNLFDDMGILLRNTDVDCLLCEFTSPEQLAKGLPVEEIDYVVSCVENPTPDPNLAAGSAYFNQLSSIACYVRRFAVLHSCYESSFRAKNKNAQVIFTSEREPEELILKDLESLKSAEACITDSASITTADAGGR